MSVITGLIHYGGEVMLCRRLARSTCSVLYLVTSLKRLIDASYV